MEFTPIETEGLVMEELNSGFKHMPVVLDDMRPDEVLVEMKYTGICHTDLVASAGAYTVLDFPAVPGHEGAGVVRAVGPEVKDTSLKVGASVILSFNHCDSCANCSAGHPACCSRFEHLNLAAKRLDNSNSAKLTDGRRVSSQFFGQSSFLKLSVVSQHSVIQCPYPENLALYAALGCGFQTGAGTVLNALKPSVDDSFLIFGAGTVGIAAIMAARYLGLRQIIVVDIVNEKLELAKELGATQVVNSREVKDIPCEIQKITDGGARFAIDCTGVSAVIDMMIDCVCCRGTVGVVGSPDPNFVLKLDPVHLLHNNKTVRGICQGDSIAQEFIPRMMELHRSGNFPLEKLCSFYDVKDFEQAINEVRNGKIIKPILKWS
ncbi:NAD(P)-binding protein [Eremomyces bilateralis CBS 781.70]|uniref:NAD(P)-binding protein n=1 Tax=Eremomyces bilateralis CBS 781.70 TaxID=1392243 RepID=A0A6G1FW97_9PEZI|nr:NAD(P)-binding protein [Eremomyces bilateralis CBS 781.70]KAF1810053.1 NAD(P)-binding protein [Eremomyces bilateralis CBS 781.70]